MPNYQNGKIYCIRNHENDDIYIGSTTQTIKNRFKGHKNNYKRWLNKLDCYLSSFEIVKYDSAYVELIEKYPCSCKEELEKREGEIIRGINSVNKVIPKRTPKEWKEDNKERYEKYQKEYKKKYNEDNKDKIQKIRKDYYNNNSEKIKDYQKKYRKEHVEKLKQYENNNRPNKEERKKKHKEKSNCVCGGKYTFSHKARHERTQKHIQFIEAQN